jgi:SAM-dependent methyltransferase
MAWQKRDRDGDKNQNRRRRGEQEERSSSPAPYRGPRPQKGGTEGRQSPARPGYRPGHGPAGLRKHATSWEQSAQWYDRILGENGSELYQQVVIPGALALLKPQAGESILDLGCGQGVFSRALTAEGAKVTGVDAAPSLIKRAKTYPSPAPIRYVARDAAKLNDLGTFDAISAILCIQNMAHLGEVCQATAKVLKPGGRMLWAMNHPTFRIPRQTSWGFDDEANIQYRRLDAYGSPLTIPIVMHPGQRESETTTSFHLSLSDLLAKGFAAGLVLAGFQEWYSHKQSEPGPRAKAENKARKEFPLFLGLLWKKVG